jgi:hypothetical protein
MQDMNKDDIFDENENKSTERHNQSVRHEVGTAFSELDKSRKIAVIFLAFFSIFLFIIWGTTTKNRINNQLKPELSTKISTEIIQNEENMGDKDSDGDGLLDWEEEDLYNTSPYLEDTDSDGILDGQEVNAGTSPVCFEGDDCSGDILQEQERAAVEMENFINDNIVVEITTTTDSGTMSEGMLSDALDGNSSVGSLRKMLLEAGMDETVLNTITDEDLLSSYQEILQ